MVASHAAVAAMEGGNGRVGIVFGHVDSEVVLDWRSATLLRHYPRQEPYAIVSLVRICAGARRESGSC